MKWVSSITKEHKDNMKKTWHRWFAWYPVTIAVNLHNRKVKVWLEWVERKGRINYASASFPDWYFEYREITK